MAPSDDADVGGDGDELLEWLWDLPERYDVGIDDDPLGSGPVPAAPVVRKHLRKPGETEAAHAEAAGDPTPTPPPLRIPSASPFQIPSQPSTPTWGPSPNPTRYDDRPTLAVDAVNPYAGEGDGPALATILASDRRPGRYNVREIASAVAVFLVVAIVVGGGYTLLRDSGSAKNRVVIESPSTTQVTTNDQGIVPPVTDTTSTSTTVPATTTTRSVPAAVTLPTTTTTTVHHPTTTTTHPTTTTTTKPTTTTSSTSTSTTSTSTTSTSTTSTTTSTTTVGQLPG